MKVGQLIANRYMLLQRIGTEPLTVVYLAQDTVMDRPVTVRILRSEIHARPAVIHQFQQAAQRAAGLSHPNLVAVQEVSGDGGIHYLVTENLPARNLRDRLDVNAPISVDEALELAIAIASGLGACHSQGIIHGDVRPENVMLGEHRTVKVAGVGVGRVLAAGHLEGEPHPYQPTAYASPEEVAGQYLTPAADIYGLGVTLYEMLTGRLPFEDQATSMTAPMHLSQDTPTVQRRNARVPAPLARIVHKMLSRDPQNRYASAQQLHQVLLSYQRQRADFSRRVGTTEAHMGRSLGTHNTETPASSATPADAVPPSPSEQEDAEEGMDWPFALLGLLTVLAILGLIILWTIVYRRYTLPAG